MGRAGFPEWWGNVWFPLGDVSHASADKGVWACEEAAVTHLFQTSSSSSKASAPQSCRYTWGKPLWITKSSNCFPWAPNGQGRHAWGLRSHRLSSRA